jgi:SRSO17 transposase
MDMSEGIERRFEAFCAEITEALEHADRRAPAQWYLKGLILPGERKSVEPMASRDVPGTIGARSSPTSNSTTALTLDDLSPQARKLRRSHELAQQRTPIKLQVENS